MMNIYLLYKEKLSFIIGKILSNCSLLALLYLLINSEETSFFFAKTDPSLQKNKFFSIIEKTICLTMVYILSKKLFIDSSLLLSRFAFTTNSSLLVIFFRTANYFT